MKKVFLISALSISVMGTAAVAQDYHHYISGKASATRLENKFTSDIGLNQVNTFDRLNLDHKKNDTVAGLRLAYGVNIPLWDNNLRAELEYGFNGKAKLDGYSVSSNVNYKSDIKSQFLMANVYYDFDLDSDWTPYVGAGIGYARVKASNSFSSAGEMDSFSKSSGNFAWNLTAGISYDVTEDFSLDASYRYMDYGKAKANNDGGFGASAYRINSESKVRANEINLGIRYRLNYNK